VDAHGGPNDASPSPAPQPHSATARSPGGWDKATGFCGVGRVAAPVAGATGRLGGIAPPGRYVHMGALLAVVLAGCAAYLLAVRAGQPPATGFFVLAREPTAVVLQGEVALWRAPAREAVPITAAVALVSDDRLQTGPSGRAAITWPHGATITLEPHSTLVLLPTATDGVTRVQLAGGALWLDQGAAGAPSAVEVLTPEGARVTGPRFRARRDAYGRLEVNAANAPLVVAALDSRQEVPPGAMTEVLPGRRPALPRPALVPPALAISVEGPVAWLVVDRYGRALGAPPDGAPQLTLVPGARGEAGPAGAATGLLPDPHGVYQLLLWAGEAPRRYRLAAWLTDGQALVGGPTPSEAPDALRLEGEIAAGTRVALSIVVHDRTVTSGEPARALTELPAWVRVAVAPSSPRGTVAASTGERSEGESASAEPAADRAAAAVPEAPALEPSLPAVATEARPTGTRPPAGAAPEGVVRAAVSSTAERAPTVDPERTPGPSFGYRMAVSFPQPMVTPTSGVDVSLVGAPARGPIESPRVAQPAQPGLAPAGSAQEGPLAPAPPSPPGGVAPSGAGGPLPGGSPAVARPGRVSPLAGEGVGMVVPGGVVTQPDAGVAGSPGGSGLPGGGASGGASAAPGAVRSPGGVPGASSLPVPGPTPVPVWTATGALAFPSAPPLPGLAGVMGGPTSGPTPSAGFLMPAAPTATSHGGLAGSLRGPAVPTVGRSGASTPVRRPAPVATPTSLR
jgi:hypothetical protein